MSSKTPVDSLQTRREFQVSSLGISRSSSCDSFRNMSRSSRKLVTELPWNSRRVPEDSSKLVADSLENSSPMVRVLSVTVKCERADP